MAGHSKWAQIKRAKAITDSKRGKIFTKLAKAITLAAQEGGGDLGSNFSLRVAVQRAKAENMPSDNIDRAIKKGAGSGDGGSKISSVIYEANGPEQVALLIGSQTDNTNRAVTEIRHIVEHSFAGKMVPAGSLSWQFEEQGLFLIRPLKFVPPTSFGKEGTYIPVNPDELQLELMELTGVIDCTLYTEEGESAIELITDRQFYASISSEISKRGYKVEVDELAYRPKEFKNVSDDAKAKLGNLIEALEDNEDVTNVWHNAKL